MPLVSSAFSLDIVPGKAPPIIHASKSDVGRTYSVTILNDGALLSIPSGTTVKIEGRIAAYTFSELASVSDNNVVFSLKNSMTKVEGQVWCKIKFESESESISSCAFWLVIDRA